MSITPEHDKRSDATVPLRREPERRASSRALGGRALALLRIAMGLVFLWAFADKLFGLGYSTTAAGAWIRGGSPTRGFLGTVEVGPLASTFHAWAGAWWADWLFMAGLLGIGLALVTGVALRIAATTGTVVLLLMWAAEWPPARFTSVGEATHSTHPIIDYHVIYALVLIALAATLAGDTWGLGRRWATVTGDRAWLR
ncbi:DoxX family membrane protein [Amycolatopsis sp. FDAARGOS 1241]|uniref:DoxX family membrane protein n=1 Tax=Amycolatopsis sp. FDAARGOS 1241 TaxID=2778070 RepID=UPI00194ED1E0|nr:DoxX family membrane protein [Amycolatopsis sp. FDAARGOS 1241]QRP42900.1 DoxX family membrane protein [Amycolatopsis sp. FDAARGOS 1241]